MTRLTTGLIAAALLAGAGAASAQATRNATIQPGKPARIHVVTALKKDCSQSGDAGSIRVTSQPKNGTTVVNGARLKTPAGYRCPNVETQVQQLIYSPKKDFQGTDEVTFETKDADGNTTTQTVKITITSKPASAPKSGGVVDL